MEGLARPCPDRSALPAGPGKLGGEAAHLPHLRPLPEGQPASSPLLQPAPGVKGHQRVVTLAQHISVTIPSVPPFTFAPGMGPGPGLWGGLVGKLSLGGVDPGCRRDQRLQSQTQVLLLPLAQLVEPRGKPTVHLLVEPDSHEGHRGESGHVGPGGCCGQSLTVRRARAPGQGPAHSSL